MLHAQLNGKCPELDNMEDILTSTFFGYLELVENPSWLKNVIYIFSERRKRKPSKNLFGSLENLEIIGNLDEGTELEFEFWPKMYDGTEPDLLLVCKTEDLTIPIMFEIKYQSGLSHSDQLVLEYENLKNKRSQVLSNIDYERGILVYLTKGKIRHTSAFNNSVEKIQDEGAFDESFTCIHLKWEEHMYRALEKCSEEQYHTDIIGKMKKYLDNRDLAPFDGFDEDFETVYPDQYYQFSISINWTEKEINPKMTWRFEK